MMKYYLLNRKMAQLKKMFLRCLHRLERKLMMMIMKLQIKLLLRSTRTRSTPEWYGNPVLEIMLLDNGEPSNYEEAMAGPDADKWLEAMKSEIGSMYDNEVWTLTDLPDDR